MSWVADTVGAWTAWYGAGAVEPFATRALTVALATVETWLDRPLELLERRQESWDGPTVILLRAWPVAELVSIEVDPGQSAPGLDAVKLDKETGRLAIGTHAWSAVTYTGGFDPMPADLEIALWNVAAALYPGIASAAGADAGGTVSRVTTPDVGTVEFRNPAGAGASTADQLLGGTLSPVIEALLQRYRAPSVVGAG